MTEYRIWRREGGMTMLHGQHREVRYAVHQGDIHKAVFPEEHGVPVARPGALVRARSVRAVGATEDLPESQWVDAGKFPAGALLRLYVPEEGK